MKKSEIYHLAMYSIIESGELYTDQKLEILRVLFEDEKVAKYTEDLEETKKQAVDQG